MSSHLPGFTITDSQTRLLQSASRAAPALRPCKLLYTNSTIWDNGMRSKATLIMFQPPGPRPTPYRLLCPTCTLADPLSK